MSGIKVAVIGFGNMGTAHATCLAEGKIRGLELAAVDLRQAMACLGEITGDQVEERLLDEVFGRFCVGK